MWQLSRWRCGALGGIEMLRPMSDPAGHFGDWQYGIYLRGMGMGERPALPVAWDALEQAARDKLAEAPRGYVWGGAGTGDTMRANLEALRAWRIVPRHLRPVEARHLPGQAPGAAPAAGRDPRPVGAAAGLDAAGTGRARADRGADAGASRGRARERARRRG